ncbi:hypothetical protein HUJ04_002576 [Dendroctonus ponderosae]|uniref:Tetratricopeptide repeat protein 18 n=1 Tax=Dendroctonus ponderosae TaxID=77166 RepID=A0AAR5PG75_DENPD|nr:hypothetical protein HUJ04_002576 [Dendroctonus ponderosae]
MSSKTSDKTQKTPKNSKLSDEAVNSQNEAHIGESLENPPDMRTIVITINEFRKIMPLFPISDIKASLKYLEVDIGETQPVPVTDDENIPVLDTFEINVDMNSPKQLDQLASNPIFVSVIQSSGSLDPALYEQLQEAKEAKDAIAVEEVDSLFSLYEAFTGEKPAVQIEERKKKKKDKKVKPEKSDRDKSKSRSKSATSRVSDKSKPSRTSKASTKADSKSKSEAIAIKSEIYGMCVIDLIPLFYSEVSFSETLLLQPVKQTCHMLSACKNFPEATVTVEIKDKAPLLVDIKNILNFTVESICNVPALMGPEMDCKICAILPLQNNEAYPVIVSNPKVTNATPPSRLPKRWPGVQDIGYNANTTKYFIENDFKEVTNKAKLNIEDGFREGAPRLEYNYLKRNILFRNSNNHFAAHIITHRRLVLELFVTPRTKKQKALDDDDNEESHSRNKPAKLPPYLHLMAVLDVVALLYPGVSKVRVAAPVKTFTFEEAANFGLTDSYFMPKPKSDLGTSKTSKTKLDTMKKKKGEKKEKASKKDKSSAEKQDKNLANQLPPKPEDPPAPEPSVQVYNEEGNPCFILVEIELLKPFKPKRNIEELQADLHELQTKAMQTSKTILNRNVADELYQQTIREIIADLNRNWIEFSESMSATARPNFENFMEYLEKNGVYQAYLGSITNSAALLISNKYSCEESDFRNNKKYQNLISEVFCDLTSQMHSILNNLVCTGMKPVEPQNLLPEDESFFNAKEATELKLFDKADRYFLERICLVRAPDLWIDYAIYNLEVKNTEKAFECLKEAIAIDCKHKYALLCFGALMADKEQIQEAETCFLNLMILESKWAEGWCVLYLFYQKCGRVEGMEMAMDMARKSSEHIVSRDYITSFEDLAWSGQNVPKTVFFKTAMLLLKLRLLSWAELALAEEVLIPKHYPYVNYLLAIASYYREDYDHALEHIEEAKESLGVDFALMSLSAHANFGKGNLEKAKTQYFHVIESFDRPEDIHLVYLKCADVLSKLGEDQLARKLLLTACKYHQTPHVWFMVGKLYFQQNDVFSAEECLNEANIKDNRHAEVWGYLTLINLKLNRLHEAEQCYQQSMKSKLDDAYLIDGITAEFIKANSI